MDQKSDTNDLTNREPKYKKNCQKKQQALKSLNNYLDQLKIHYDLSEREMVKILELILKIKNKDALIKKLWNIFK